jgi:phage shock protein PspC (stress-responsive transcriptional regulator)
MKPCSRRIRDRLDRRIVVAMTETTETTEIPAPEDQPLLVRPREGRMIAGVCAGIAKRWNVDLTLVRIGAVALTLISGIGLAVYLATWLLTPSSDGPAPVRPGGRGMRWASRLPALLLIVIAAVALGVVGHALWWGAPIGLLIALLVIAIVVGTRRGRWLLVTVAGLLVLALATVGVFGPHFGERSYHVGSLADLRGSYEYGAGKVNLDLTDLSVSGRHRTEVHLGRGNITVTVPNDVAVWVHGRAGVGSVTIDGHKIGGIDAEQSRLLGVGTESDEDRLTVDAVVGVGHVDIRTA